LTSDKRNFIDEATEFHCVRSPDQPLNKESCFIDSRLQEINVHDIDLDRIDRRILDHLQGNARASNLELAEAASLSPAQCHRRHRRLEEAGYVARYETRLNAARIGLTVVAFIHVSMERGHVRELQKFKDLLASLVEVQECYAVTGDFDYVLKVVARDLPALSRFLMDTLMRLPGVAAVRSSVCMEEIKCTSALPLPG
jgi:Lrp/AsnC family leucine-responsive transcriptional regulator